MDKTFKRVVLAALVAIASSTAWSFNWTQYNESVQGDKFLVNAGIGLGYETVGCTHVTITNTWWWDAKPYVGLAVPVKGEFLLQKIPLGIYVSVRPFISSIFSTSIIAGADWHVDPGVTGLDLYAGVGFGVDIVPELVERIYNGGSIERKTIARFAFDTHIGASYYFTETFGVNAEVGYPNFVSVSAAFKF